MSSIRPVFRLAALPALAWLLASCAATTFPAGEPCVAHGFSVTDDFAGARRGACTLQSRGRVSLEIRPESEGPINPSAWYAFRITPQGAEQAALTLHYARAYHRYLPKISSNGHDWQLLGAEFVAVAEDRSSAQITVPLGEQAVWIAAQEVLPPRVYENWYDTIAAGTGFAPQVLGRSTRGRGIHVFDTDPGLREVLLLTGRQHPPEVSGAFAFLAFAETVLGDSPLAARFRERFRIIAIPLLNPDGVVGGHWRHNVNDTDLNRDWGLFREPETMLIADLLARLDGEGSRLRVFIDFHSTDRNVFYTQHNATDPPGFTASWLGAAARRMDDYSFGIGNAPAKQLHASKNYMYLRYGIPSVTYEVGDETDRDAARAAARIFAEELMRKMLELDPPPGEFDPSERTIPELQAAMAAGETTSEQLVRHYLKRIGAFDLSGPRLGAMIHVNPRAVDEAIALDRERAATGPRGPLHGIPIVLKDNYGTHDMPTTAGSVALAGFVPPDDASQVRRLREAGAVFMGKTNLHEFARGIETISSLGGATRNPYDPRRNPGGSSGGTAAAVAANFAAAGTGSDTCGSIRIPAANNNLFGLRVTQGLSDMDGIVPLSHTQDVAGPLARSVVDLVTMLDASIDGATFGEHLRADALRGARLGLLVDYLDASEPSGAVSGVVRNAVERMAGFGAEVVEIEVEGLDALLRTSSVINYEFTTDVAAWFAAAGAPVRSVEELLAGGQYHEALEERYRRSVASAGEGDEYRRRLARRETLARMLNAALDKHDLDALVYPTLRVKPELVGEKQTGSLCRIAAHSGLPAISMPAGFTGDGLPVGIELLARPMQDSRLVELAYSWEQQARPRVPPAATPSLAGDAAEPR